MPHISDVHISDPSISDPYVSDREYFSRKYEEFSTKADQTTDPDLSRVYADFAQNYKKAAQRTTDEHAIDGPKNTDSDHA